MINLFKTVKQGKGISRYIRMRLKDVCEEVRPEDSDVVEYLIALYRRVTEDVRLVGEEHDLGQLLDKMEEDLLCSPECFGERACFILQFLKADLLRYSLSTSTNDEALIMLGRVRDLYCKFFSDDGQDAYDMITPGELKRHVDQYVIGQEQAKKTLCAAVYRHEKQVRHPEEQFASKVVLLIGPSGCGKTEIMRRIKEITDLPMICTDVSSLGASQYRGRHKEDLLLALWNEAGRKKELAEKGILFMDEFDKILLPAFSERGIDVHDDVQSQLLTMLEGSDVELKVNGKVLTLNTSNMLFVLAGAFQGIEENIRRVKLKNSSQGGLMGFNNPLLEDLDVNYLRDNIDHEVLMDYGMKRELAGRISSIAVLENLKKEDLVRILTVPKDNLIERYRREFQLYGNKELEFTPEALDKIVTLAMEEKTGARALGRLVRQAVRDYLYFAPSHKELKKIVITEDEIDA